MDSTTSTPEVTASPTLLFRVGASLYGCDIIEAQEIIPPRAATRLPGAPPYVRGLINIRGTIVTVLDLGQRLDPARAPVRDGSILLVRHRDRIVGLIVDAVTDVRVLDVDEVDGSSPPHSADGIVRGTANADGRTVSILDLDCLIQQVLIS